MLNEVGRCTSCGEQKLQIRENVNKRIGMCENLVLFASVVRRIFILQVEKDKKSDKRSVADVTTLGGGLTLINLSMHFDFSQPLAEHSYQSYITYLEKKLTVC